LDIIDDGFACEVAADSPGQQKTTGYYRGWNAKRSRANCYTPDD